MNRRHFLFTLPALGACAPMTACSLPEPLTIGVLPWPGYEPLYLAEHFGWLPPDVRLAKAGSATESLDALRSEAIDGAALTLDEVLLARAEGLPLSVVLVLNESLGADVVLAREGIAAPADLRGRRIAVERSAVGGVVLIKLLAAGGLKAADVTVVDLPHDRQVEAWKRGEVDAVITYAPTDARIQRMGGHVIFDSRQFPGTIFDVLALRRDRLRWRSGAVEGLIGAHLAGLEHLRVSREDAVRRIAGWRNLQVEEIERGFGGLALPDLARNRHILSAGGTLHGAAKTLCDILVQHGQLSEPDDLDDLVLTRFLPEPEAAR